MKMDELPLARQVDLAFRQMHKELSMLSDGTVFLQIRNNRIGKFGIRHYDAANWTESGSVRTTGGLTESQRLAFRNMALEAIKRKTWSHGEIQFEFAVRKGLLTATVQYESNYNMAALDPSVVHV
ncbi:hypothetical protein XYCOK13_12500 [Xylanibacillus composti]|uniref:O-methyltransferase n=2 Tax=Xylanibacillus composti TaxID=1572762 RepID=A0A8J4H2S1_9BACL|nr:O-methyltransferase [Xylanibacillus composti]GIQ68426.1 hypothetical protein XYCOK13_12500 [Xylanibacillus composti]